MKTKLLILLTVLGISNNCFSQDAIDLFIWAGQSNAQGWQGDAAHYPTDPDDLDSQVRLNYIFIERSRSDGWIEMQPQEGRFESGHFGPEVTFSRKLVEAGYNPAIFKYTRGATSIYYDWLAPGEGGYYDAMVADLETAISDLESQGHSVNIKGFVWIQGESDAETHAIASTYETSLLSIIGDLRNNVVGNSALPVILGVDEQHPDMVDHPAVLDAHKTIAGNDDQIIFTSMYGLPKADPTHLTPAGLETHGEQIFQALEPLLATGMKEPELPKSDKPNVVIFLADDLGFGDLGSYGNPIIKTPHIDQFAAEGVRMTDFHSGGTVCSPSRAALLTGRNPYRSGFFYIASTNTYLKDDELTIAELLKTEGYETSFWGKWHLSNLEKERRNGPGPGEQGFDYWLGTTLNAFEGPENPASFLLNGEPVGEVEGWYCDVIVDKAGQWLEQTRDKDKPFLMFVSSHEPHTPIAPPAGFSEPYQNDAVDTLEKSTKYGGVSRPKKDISKNKAAYYGTVTQLDEAFGRLMQKLEDLGLEENTIVIFTSDNGPESPVTLEESFGEWEDNSRDFSFGTPGEFRGMKRFPYEGGHRVPGIVRYPNAISAGTESHVLFNQTDILPTIAKLAGAETPTDRPVDGVNAFNAFLNEEVSRDSSSIWFYPNHGDSYFRMPQMSMRSGDYTLLGYLPDPDDPYDLKTWMAENDPVRFELYDITADPSQSKDIANEYPHVVASMKLEMTDLWRAMKAEGLSGKVNKH